MDRRNFNRLTLSGALAAAFPTRYAFGQAVAAMTKIDSDLEAVTRTGGTAILEKAAIKEFQKSLTGQLVLPTSEAYDGVRKVWNAMIDKRPALIARCTVPSDVIKAVDFARSNDLLVSVRGGGHSISGKAVCEGGLMIDLFPLRSVRVDPFTETARVEGGALLGNLDREAQHFGLATTAGTVSHTGVAGLTLGGGHGRLGRRHGLACDNVRSVDIVTADGAFLQASEKQNEDLFWGIRGGGGNFGVVTSFDFQLHKVGPVVLGGPIMYPMAQGKQVLKAYAAYAPTVPNELTLDAVLVSRPGGPAFVMIDVFYTGRAEDLDNLLAPLRAAGKPIADQVREENYVEVQKRADQGTPWGRFYYNKAGVMTALPDDAIDKLIDRFDSDANRNGDPGRTTLVIIQHLGGKIAELAPEDTAYAHRDAQYDFLTLAGWDDPAREEENIDFLRGTFAEIEPYTIGFYGNHMVESDNPRARSAFRGNYDRLVEIKNKYDPKNLFRLNANVKPTV